ncbi:MAG: ligand-binding sensor domain-containing protein, partial [Acidobacteriota bacterium]
MIILAKTSDISKYIEQRRCLIVTANFLKSPERGSRARRAPPPLATLGILVCLLGIAAPAAAQHYNITLYEVADGLPASRVLSLFQDSRGYLWMGTTGGVARYNGEEFRVLTRADGMTGNTVVAIGEAPSGEILLGSQEGGLDAWDGSAVSRVLPESLEVDTVLAVRRDGDRTWVGTESGLLRVGADVSRYGPDQGLPDARVHAILVDRRDRIWVGTGAGLARWDEGRFRPMGGGLPPRTAVRALVDDSGGQLWVGTDAGLYRETATGFQRVRTPLGRAGVEPAVTAAAAHGSGRLWFGTDRGALQVSGSTVSVLDVGNGLADGHVNAVLVDREGNVWFGTDRGVAKLVPGPFSHFTVADGLPDDFVSAVAAAGDHVWVGTRAGVARVDAGGEA